MNIHPGKSFTIPQIVIEALNRRVRYDWPFLYILNITENSGRRIFITGMADG